MNHQSRRTATKRYDWSKHIPNHPVGGPEYDCPHWDDSWYEHCTMEAPYVDTPTQGPMRSDTTDWCALPLNSPMLRRGHYANKDSFDAGWFMGCFTTCGLVDDSDLAYPPCPVNPLTKPLVEAAARKEQEMLLKGPAFAETAPIYNGGHAQLATVRCQEDYALTMKLYRIRCSAQGTRREQWAQRLWDQHSAASVLATRQPCPTL